MLWSLCRLSVPELTRAASVLTTAIPFFNILCLLSHPGLRLHLHNGRHFGELELLIYQDKKSSIGDWTPVLCAGCKSMETPSCSLGGGRAEQGSVLRAALSILMLFFHSAGSPEPLQTLNKTRSLLGSGTQVSLPTPQNLFAVVLSILTSQSLCLLSLHVHTASAFPFTVL